MPDTKPVRTDEIPSWFSYKNYEAAKDFKAYDWYIQLSARIDCDDILRTWLSNKALNPEVKIPDIFKDIRKNPILDLKNSAELHGKYMDGAIHEILSASPIHTNAIYPLTIYDLNALNKLNHNYLNNDDFDDRYAETGNVLGPIVHLNLDMPNKVLFDSFRVIVEELRRNHNKFDTRKEKHKLKYDDWYKIGLLPYIDLHHYAVENNLQIIKNSLVRAIAPNGEISESSMQKTTRKTAIDIFGKHSTFNPEYKPSVKKNCLGDESEYYSPLFHELLSMATDEIKFNKAKAFAS